MSKKVQYVGEGGEHFPELHLIPNPGDVFEVRDDWDHSRTKDVKPKKGDN